MAWSQGDDLSSEGEPDGPDPPKNVPIVDQRKHFHAETNAMRAFIKQRTRFVFHEPHMRWIPVFDNVVSLCVLFVSIVSPVEITMTTEITFSMAYGIGLLCNVVFFADFLIKLFRTYRESFSAGGRWVKNRKKIIQHYARGWLLVDVLSFIPFDLPFALGTMDAGGFESTLRLLNLVKLIRVLKLIYALPRILGWLAARFGWSNALCEIVKFSLMLLLLIHYLACWWVWTGLNWTPTEGTTVCLAYEADGETCADYDEQPWIVYYSMDTYPMYRLYAVATYVSIVAIFGGVSSVSPQNFLEYCTLTMMMFAGGMAWAYVLSMLCSIFSALNPRETEHKNMMDELSHFMAERSFSRVHRQRLRDFFNYTKDYAREVGYGALFERMSLKLRADTAMIIGEGDLGRVWYLHPRFNKSRYGIPTENGYLCDLALNMKPMVHEIHETMPYEELAIISRGLCAQNVKLLGVGASIGDNCIIDDNLKSLKHRDPATCLSFVYVHCISRTQIYRLAEPYPFAMKMLKRAAAFMAITSAMTLYYRVRIKKNGAKLQGAQQLEDVVHKALNRGRGSNDGGKSCATSVDLTHSPRSGVHGSGGSYSDARIEELIASNKELSRLVTSLLRAQKSADDSAGSVKKVERSTRCRSSSADHRRQSLSRSASSFHLKGSPGSGGAKIVSGKQELSERVRASSGDGGKSSAGRSFSRGDSLRSVGGKPKRREESLMA